MSLYMDINKEFKNFKLNIKLDLKNEIVGILGYSGSGKSITLKTIAGIINPDWGKIILDNKKLFSSKEKINIPTRKRKVGYLFQDYALFPNLSAIDNIRICLPKERRDEAEEFLKRFHVYDVKDQKPFELSGGEQQRVALSRMICVNPDIILLDEPFSALDSGLKWEIQNEFIKFLKTYNKTTIFVSHDKDEIYRLCDKVAIIDNGSVISYDDKDKIFNHPISLKAAKIIGVKNITTVIRKDDYLYSKDWNTSFDLKENARYVAFKDDIFSLEKGNSYIDFDIENIIEDTKNIILVSKGYNKITATFDKKNIDKSLLERNHKVRLFYDEKNLMTFK
ncbi:MAG: ATP-binding cassette domain-containing protein [Tissierellia bacterium]|nr:ATP-binding cassette domain-containing protein [Tissierellia bacterium]